MMDDPRKALLAAALAGATAGARTLNLRGVEVRRMVSPPQPPKRPIEPPVMPRATAMAPTLTVEAEVEAIRRAWAAASPEARRRFLSGLA